MRRIWLAALVALPFVAEARELQRGTLEVSGSTSADFSKQTIEIEGVSGDIDVTSRQLELGGLYYLGPNLGLGAFVSHEFTETEFGTSKSTDSTTVLGPALGVKVSTSERLSLFGTFGVGIARGEIDDVDLEGYGLQVGGGLSIFLIDQASFDVGLVYAFLSLEDDFGTSLDTQGFGLTLGLSLYFGG